MMRDSYRELLLEQLLALDARQYFKTNPDTLPDYLAVDGAFFAPSEKQILKNYREITVDILEDANTLANWTQKAASS
jgi:hypothetical protein